jgi:hypothetical protein
MLAIKIKAVNGWTALMLASENGYTEVLKILLKAGPDLMITVIIICCSANDTTYNTSSSVNIKVIKCQYVDTAT